MVQVEPIVTAHMPMPDAYTYRPRNPLKGAFGLVAGPKADAVCLAFVVRHPSAGTLLVDTGFHPDALRDKRSDFGLAMSLLFRGLEPTGTFDDQLRERAIEPDGVERVLMTHLHADHTSGMRLLPKATFVVAREEWHNAHGSTKGFVAKHLPPEARVEQIDLEAGEPWGPFAHSHDLLGDGSIRLLSTPGHTAGHMSVLVETDDGLVLIVGDAAYTVRSIDEQHPPLITGDGRRFGESLRRLKTFRDQHPDATVVPSHDGQAWRALERAPAAG